MSTGEGRRPGALPRCPRPEGRGSVLTPKEALRSPFPGGDHLFLATSTSRSRGAVRRSRGTDVPCSRGGGYPLPGSSDPSPEVSCIRRRPWARRSIAHPLRPRPEIPSADHVNGPAKFPARGGRPACAGFIPHLTAWPAGDSPSRRVARAPNPLPDADLCQSFPRQHCSHGFPRRASTEPLGMNPSGMLAIRRTLFVTRPLPERGGGLFALGGRIEEPRSLIPAKGWR